MAHALESMGIDATEEAAYRALLTEEGRTSAEVARAIKTSLRSATATLRALEARGMVTHSPDRVQRYFAVPPDVAVAALVAASQRSENYRQDRARAAIAELADLVNGRAKTHGDVRLVEILSPETTAQLLAQMYRAATTELLSLTRQPMLIQKVDEPDHILFEALARGIRSRNLIDGDLLTQPGWLEQMRDNARHGEECRVAASLPFKLLIADRHTAIIPLDLRRPDGPILLVRSPSLLEALCEMFELLWLRATPFVAASVADTGGAPPGEALLALLASGLNDKAIELELGISHRTLARRIGALMKEFGATTRCQLGWLAARRANATSRT